MSADALLEIRRRLARNPRCSCAAIPLCEQYEHPIDEAKCED